MSVNWNKSSFRDPDGHVFEKNNCFFRTVSDVVFAKRILSSSAVKNGIKNKSIIGTTLIKNKFDGVSGDYILEHEKIPFLTYPYEWSFSQLKDAALLTLEVQKQLLSDNLILKDGSAYNVAFIKNKPVFFDILSIASYQDGDLWSGYQQFCEEFLYPLMLKSYKNINFQNMYKGNLKGIDSNAICAFFGLNDILKPGILKHVLVKKILKKNAKIEQKNVSNQYKLSKFALTALIENLISLINGLSVKKNSSVWINYDKDNTYQNLDTKDKEQFITEFSLSISKGKSIIDLGANTGHFSEIAEKNNLHIVASDLDADCIDSIYKKNIDKNITPVVFDIMNPSPFLGFELLEQSSLFSRIQPEGFLSLALIHHVCIGSNVPLKRFIPFLKSVATSGVIEWVGRDDTMVKFLKRYRKHDYEDYNQENFESILRDNFIIRNTLTINNGNRILYWVTQ